MRITIIMIVVNNNNDNNSNSSSNNNKNNNSTNTNSNNKKYVCLGADVRQMDFDSSLRLFQQRDAARSDDLLLRAPERFRV